MSDVKDIDGSQGYGPPMDPKDKEIAALRERVAALEKELKQLKRRTIPTAEYKYHDVEEYY